MQPDAHKRALIAGSIGNFIEWYEFAVYGFLATVIAKNFFQLEGEAGLTSLILTYASFAIAFFFRPLGAVVFGRIGDRIGRKPTLIIVLVLMTLATAAIGIVPVYASIGIAAPLIITLLRILQGLFAGGEYGGAVSLMTEFAPRGKRGLYGAWQSFTVALGLLAGAGIVALLIAVISNIGFALTIIPSGILSDRIGRRTVMILATALLLILALPLLKILQAESSTLAVKAVVVLIAGGLVGMLAGPGPAMLSEMFPTRVRYTGLGLAYSLSNAIFSGCAGLIITGLIKQTGNLDIPAYYVMATAVVSIFALMTLRKDDHLRSLEE